MTFMSGSGRPNNCENAQMLAANAEPSMVMVMSVTPIADIKQPIMPILWEPPDGAA